MLSKKFYIRVKNSSFYENLKTKGAMFMFKKTLTFSVGEAETIRFCRILGKYGLRFKIGKLQDAAKADGNDRGSPRREFTVYASKRKAYALYEELNATRDRVF